jgi:hypothetical protein
MDKKEAKKREAKVERKQCMERYTRFAPFVYLSKISSVALYTHL